MRFLNGHAGGEKGGRPREPLPTWQEEDWGYETPCWIWQGSVDPNGYALVSYPQTGQWLGHRSTYEQHRRQLDSDEHLHHECRVRSCVNPDHLTPMPTPADHGLAHRTVDRDAVKAARASGERPVDTRARLGISITSYYRALKS